MKIILNIFLIHSDNMRQVNCPPHILYIFSTKLFVSLSFWTGIWKELFFYEGYRFFATCVINTVSCLSVSKLFDIEKFIFFRL